MRAILIGALAVALFVHTHSAASVQTVTGVVVDQIGGLIPGAEVTLATARMSRTAVSDVNGAFTFESVPIGRATLTVALTGFKTERREVLIGENLPVSVKITLSVGALTETVMVTGATPTVSAQSSTVSSNARGAYRVPSAPGNTEAYDRIDATAARTISISRSPLVGACGRRSSPVPAAGTRCAGELRLPSRQRALREVLRSRQHRDHVQLGDGDRSRVLGVRAGGVLVISLDLVQSGWPTPGERCTPS